MNENAISAEDQELPRFRAEVEVSEQVYDGQPYWVLKDPLSLRYYRFNREEYFIIEQLRRGVTLRQLKEAHRREFNSDLLNNGEIGQFVRDLNVRNLVENKHPQRDEIFFKAAKRKWRGKFISQISNFLFFKIPLYDPDKLLDRIIPHLRFLWTRSFFLLYLMLLALGGFLIMRRWPDFSSMFQSNFFTIYNAPLVFAVFWLVKAIHEFGHGLTCKNYGGEVHDIGLLVMIFMPFLYCNITDSWTFRSKAHRLLTSSGGILSELMIAALGAIVWYYTDQPGFVHAFAFNVVIVCSISTVLFNANPLMKFDGYYILMDLIEVPNLRQRSGALIRNFFIRHLLGGRTEEMHEEHRYKFIFPLYAIAAVIYRWFIMFAILFMVYDFLKQMHLAVLGRFIFVLGILTTFIVPLTKTGITLQKQRASLGISHIRLLFFLVLLTVGIAVVLFFPMQQHVTLNFILEPEPMHWVRSEAAGEVHWEKPVSEGAWLGESASEKGLLARLMNPDLKLKAVQMSAQIQQVELEMAYYNRQESENKGRLEQMNDRLQTLRREKQRLDEQIANLEVFVLFHGEVLSSDEWLRQLDGRFVPRGTPLLLLGDSRRMVAKVWVPEAQFARIFKQPEVLGQGTELMLYAFADQKFTGQVTAVSRHREENMGEFGEKLALSNKVGGEVLTEYDPAVGQEKPVEAVYEVTINLELQELPVSARPYMSGRAHIECGHSTLYQWGKDSLLRFISPEVRL